MTPAEHGCSRMIRTICIVLGLSSITAEVAAQAEGLARGGPQSLQRRARGEDGLSGARAHGKLELALFDASILSGETKRAAGFEAVLSGELRKAYGVAVINPVHAIRAQRTVDPPRTLEPQDLEPYFAALTRTVDCDFLVVYALVIGRGDSRSGTRMAIKYDVALLVYSRFKKSIAVYSHSLDRRVSSSEHLDGLLQQVTKEAVAQVTELTRY